MSRPPSELPRALRALGLTLMLAGCANAGVEPGPRLSPAVHSTTATTDVTILYTSDEHGWILPFVDKGAVRGGAGEMLAKWVADEGHCPSDAGKPSCIDPPTAVVMAMNVPMSRASSPYWTITIG